jgi:small GTP-binding protein
MSENEKEEYVFKIAVLGAAGTGKTSLIDKFVSRKFQVDYKPTLGASIIAKDISMENCDVRLVLWDIAGQEKYESVRSMYLGGAQGAILVYDLTRRPSFDEIRKKWFADVQSYANPGAKFILIGNKVDLEEKRNVSTEEGQQLAEDIDTTIFLETSAKTGENVEEAFISLVKEILEKLEQNHKSTEATEE